MKTYLLCVCLLLCHFTFAQKQSISVNFKPSLTFFGKQSQKFDAYYFESSKGQSSYNNAFNILYSYQLHSKIALSTGLEYAQQGQTLRMNADPAISSFQYKDFEIELDYFRIPVHVNYTLVKKSSYSLQAYTGVSVGFANKRKDNLQNIIAEMILLPDSKTRYNKTDWSIPIGLNYRKNIGKHIFVNIGAEFMAGLSNSFSDEPLAKFGVLDQFDNSRQNRLALNIGAGIPIGK